MKAVIKENLGALKKGEIIVVTGFKKDKAFFFVEKDPSLVGIVSKASLEDYNIHLRREAAINFLKCHRVISKSNEFLKKVAAEFFGLVDQSVLDQLSEIKQDLSISKDEVVNSLTVSPPPAINANLRLADASHFFSIRNVVPTENATIGYIKASLSAHTGLPETTWTDDVIKMAIRNREAEEPLEWSDKMMRMMQWHLDQKLPGEMWNELQRLVSLNDLGQIRDGINLLFDKASNAVKNPPKMASTEKEAYAPPPMPTDPVGPNEEYVFNPATNNWVKQIKQSALKDKKKI